MLRAARQPTRSSHRGEMRATAMRSNEWGRHRSLRCIGASGLAIGEAVPLPHEGLTVTSQQHDSREFIARGQPRRKRFNVRSERGVLPATTCARTTAAA